MPRRLVPVLGMAAAMLVVPTQSFAGAVQRLDPREALAISELAVGRLVRDSRLVDSSGAALSLAGFRGKPLIVSLVYTSCSTVCPPTTQHLRDAVEAAGRILGLERFSVLTVGFDARNDSPARMAQFASVQGVTSVNWRFASADGAALRPLLDDLGFSYAAVAGGFDHVVQTTIIDRDGRVYRQIYGDDFPVSFLVEPLIDAVEGSRRPLTLAGVANRIRLVCTTFDPATGRYRIDYGLVFGSVIAALSLALFGGLLLREWRRAGKT